MAEGAYELHAAVREGADGKLVKVTTTSTTTATINNNDNDSSSSQQRDAIEFELMEIVHGTFSKIFHQQLILEIALHKLFIGAGFRNRLLLNDWLPLLLAFFAG